MSQADWHSGFSGGLRLSLRHYKDGLDIEREHYITDEPTRMDLLIIKKDKDAVVDNSVGRAFRGHNIIEYKNPNDALNIDVVWKTIGYAGLYKGYGGRVDAIPAQELTVTILRSAKPVKLFRYLAAKGYAVRETAPGVYLLSGFIDMPIQVAVIRELKDEEFRPLRIMVPGADEGEIRDFLKESLLYSEPEDLHNVGAVLNVSSEVNEATFEKLRRDDDMGDAMRRIMKDDLAESEQRGEQRGEQNALLQSIRNLMETLKLTLEQAMDALKIPADQRSIYTALVNKK